MKFGLFGKPHVSDKKIIITKSTENEYFLDFRSSHVHNLFRQLHRKTTVLESLFSKVADLSSPATLLKRDSIT